MDKIQKALVEVLSYAIHDHEPVLPQLTSDDWYSLYIEAREHGVHLMIANLLKKHNIVIGDEETTKVCNNVLFVTALYHQASITKMPEIFDKLKENNIEIVIVKGWYFKTLYPNPSLRVMGDVDFLVKKEDLDKTGDVLKSIGYTLHDESHSEMHHMYTHPKHITLEVHFSLLGSTFSDEQRVFDEIVRKEKTTKTINSQKYFVPSDVNHAVYCCIHMMNHLRSSGFGLRNLCDLVLLIKNSEQYGWDEFFEKTKMMQINNFARAILSICHKYLGLEISIEYTNYINSLDKDKIDRLRDDILRSGEFGIKDKEYLLSKTLAEYHLNSKTAKNGKFSNFLFPSNKKLNHVYGYAKKYGVLLPVAWIHRLMLNLFRTDLSIRNKIPNSKIMNDHEILVNWLNEE